MSEVAGHGGRNRGGRETGRLARPKPVVPDHELIRRIGAGSYGEVWLARNVMGTLRAVKIVHRVDFTDDRPYEREFRGIQRFEPLSRSNEGFVDVLQIGRDDALGLFYYVMELADDCGSGSLEGYAPRTLASEVRGRGRLPVGECLPTALTLTLALAHLHRHGLIHRDVKPSNIVFIGGVPKLADIGLVTEVEEARSFVGTEGFIPPEGPNSPQADIYSLGKVFYEMSMGKDRLDFPEPYSGLGQAGESPSLEEFNAVILRACDSDPRRRYRSAEEMHVDLALLQSGKSVRSRRRLEQRIALVRKAAVLVAAIAAVAGGGFLFQRQQAQTARRLQQYAEGLVGRMQVAGAEALLDRDESELALAQLAAVVRLDPSNRVAAERMLDALARRRFPEPVVPALVHAAPVTAARFSPDGRSIAGVTEDHTVRIWDARTGAARPVALRHEDRVTALMFSPDGALLATASNDGTARLWRMPEGVPAVPPVWHAGRVNAICFSPDGRWLATAGEAEGARMVEVETGATRHPVLPHGDGANDVRFSPDGRRLATVGGDGLVRVWEAESGRMERELPFPGRGVLVRFSPDGLRLAVTLQRGAWEVRVWDVGTGRLAGPVLPHGHRLNSIAFSPDGSRLGVATGDNEARIWEIKTGRPQFVLPHAAPVYVVEFSPDGRRLLTTALDHTARLWDAASGRPVLEPMRHAGRVVDGGFDRTGDRVLTASWDRTIQVWNARTASGNPRTMDHGLWVLSAEYDPDGRRLLTWTGGAVFTANSLNAWALGRTNTLTLWRVGEGEEEPETEVVLPPAAEPMVAQFTGAGVRALVLNRFRDASGRIWHVNERRPAAGVVRHGGVIASAHFRPDGRVLATGAGDGTARLWEADSGRPIGAPLRHGSPVRVVRFRPDGALLLTAGEDGRVRFWDGRSGVETGVALVPEDPSAVTFARFSPDGTTVLTASLDACVRLWSADGRLRALLRHGAPVEWAEFTADGTRVATASGDRTARVWSAVTGQPLTEPLTHDQLVTVARFSPDGRRLITASFDGTARIWDVESGLKLSDPVRHGGWVVDARFSPDGRTALSASLDQTVKRWSVPMVSVPVPERLAEQAETAAGFRLKLDGSREPVPASRVLTAGAKTSTPGGGR